MSQLIVLDLGRRCMRTIFASGWRHRCSTANALKLTLLAARTVELTKSAGKRRCKQGAGLPVSWWPGFFDQ